MDAVIPLIRVQDWEALCDCRLKDTVGDALSDVAHFLLDLHLVGNIHEEGENQTAVISGRNISSPVVNPNQLPVLGLDPVAQPVLLFSGKLSDNLLIDKLPVLLIDEAVEVASVQLLKLLLSIAQIV